MTRGAWREKAGRNDTCRKVKNAHSWERLDFCDVATECVTYKNICVPDWNFTILLRQWNYVAVTYNQRSGIGTIWRNSRPIAFQKLGWVRLATKSPLRVGGAPRGRRPFRGSIACLQVYKDALTGPQIKNVQNICFGPGNALLCGLLGLST